MPQYKKDVKVGLCNTVIAYSVVGCEEGIGRHYRNRGDEVLHVLHLFRGLHYRLFELLRHESMSMCTCGSVAFPMALPFASSCIMVTSFLFLFT